MERANEPTTCSFATTGPHCLPLSTYSYLALHAIAPGSFARTTSCIKTLRCDTMNGQPLSREHGAPLRIYLSVKYGWKSLKRLGRSRFQDQRPADYWAERAYGCYAGL